MLLCVSYNPDTDLSHFLKVLVAFLQRSGSVEGLSHPRVFAEEGLAVVFYPVQNLRGKNTPDSPRSRERLNKGRPPGGAL